MSDPENERQRDTFLPFSPPDITQEEISAVVDTLNSSWITTGPKTKQFEEAFATYINTQSALALNSCTAGLHLALVSLGIGAGDEVITSSMTFCASVNVIEHVNAMPILVDIEPDTLNIDPVQIKSAITDKTKAIMPVHYAGHPAEMDAIVEIATAHNLFIIEDAAHALPATYKGANIGTIGDFTSFSFYATKNLTTAEGGMLTASPEMLDNSRILSLHGMSRDAWNRYDAEGSWYYEVVAPGYKYNMTDIQAALGLAQLKRLEEMQRRRKEIVRQYQQAFSAIEAVKTPIERSHVEHAWHLYVLRLNLDQLTITRSQFIHELKARNIGASVHFIPVHMHPYYAHKYNWKPDDFPITHNAYQCILSLPLNNTLSDRDVEDVINAVVDIITSHRR